MAFLSPRTMELSSRTRHWRKGVLAVDRPKRYSHSAPEESLVVVFHVNLTKEWEVDFPRPPCFCRLMQKNEETSCQPASRMLQRYSGLTNSLDLSLPSLGYMDDVPSRAFRGLTHIALNTEMKNFKPLSVSRLQVKSHLWFLSLLLLGLVCGSLRETRWLKSGWLLQKVEKRFRLNVTHLRFVCELYEAVSPRILE